MLSVSVCLCSEIDRERIRALRCVSLPPSWRSLVCRLSGPGRPTDLPHKADMCSKPVDESNQFAMMSNDTIFGLTVERSASGAPRQPRPPGPPNRGTLLSSPFAMLVETVSPANLIDRSLGIPYMHQVQVRQMDPAPSIAVTS
jgi:hypothetical protein